MISSRYYSVSRRAYLPRVWPIALLAIAVTVVIAGVVNPSPWVGVPVVLVFAYASMFARLAAWKHRHPPRMTKQTIDAMRDAARWN